MTHKRRVFLAAVLLIALYTPAAIYLQWSFADGPADLQPLHVYRSAHPGVYAATMWMAVGCRKASIYETGSRIGETNNVVAHPGRDYSFAGRRWTVAEFNLSHDPKGRRLHGRPAC